MYNVEYKYKGQWSTCWSSQSPRINTRINNSRLPLFYKITIKKNLYKIINVEDTTFRYIYSTRKIRHLKKNILLDILSCHSFLYIKNKK